jgi:hypothetical protein
MSPTMSFATTEVRYAAIAVRFVARAEASEVRRDDPKVRRQGGDLLSPGARCFGKPVEQDDERALSFHDAAEPDAVDLDVAVHPAMLACPMPVVRACPVTSPSVLGSSRVGSPWSSG